MTSETTEIAEKSPVWQEGTFNGGKLRRGGPGRPKMRDTVAGVLRDFMLSVPGKEEPGIIHALMNKALSGDTRAIELCLHYGIGKPTDKVEVSGPEGGPIQSQSLDLTDRERSALQDAIDAELKRRAEESAD